MSKTWMKLALLGIVLAIAAAVALAAGVITGNWPWN